MTAGFIATLGTDVAYLKPTLVALVVGLVSLAAFYGVILLTGSKRGGPNSS